MTRSILAGFVTASVLALSAAPAMAGENSPKSVEIDIAGIDLTTQAGTDLVLRKVKRAARSACSVQSGTASLSELNRSKACVRHATESAIASMDQQRDRQAALKARPAG